LLLLLLRLFLLLRLLRLLHLLVRQASQFAERAALLQLLQEPGQLLAAAPSLAELQYSQSRLRAGMQWAGCGAIFCTALHRTAGAQ
jgi:hypothetical protein